MKTLNRKAYPKLKHNREAIRVPIVNQIKISCPACGSYSVTPTSRVKSGKTCEYHCDDCGEYFTGDYQDG